MNFNIIFHNKEGFFELTINPYKDDEIILNLSKDSFMVLKNDAKKALTEVYDSVSVKYDGMNIVLEFEELDDLISFHEALKSAYNDYLLYN